MEKKLEDGSSQPFTQIQPGQNEPPPPYPLDPSAPAPSAGVGPSTAGPPQLATAEFNAALSANLAVHTSIQEGGRSPVTVVCPTCMKSGLTEVNVINNNDPQNQGHSKQFYVLLIGLGIFLFIFSFVAMYALNWFALGAVILFILCGLSGFFGYYVVNTSMKMESKIDVEHKCGHCKVVLGINRGEENMRRFARRYNRRY